MQHLIAQLLFQVIASVRIDALFAACIIVNSDGSRRIRKGELGTLISYCHLNAQLTGS
jgi:hypothetical protein